MADVRYGSRLKRETFLKRVFTNPFMWILVILEFVGYAAEGDVTMRYGMALTFLVLLIGVFIFIYRGVYGAGVTDHYPDVRYTCRLCGHQWASQGFEATEAPETGAAEATAEIAPEETAEDRTAQTHASGPQAAQTPQTTPITGTLKLDPGTWGCIIALLLFLAFLAFWIWLGSTS
jgi:hypothetical protein